MKIRIVIIVSLMLTFIVSSCLVKSLHPFYKESDIEFRPELLGTWMDQDSSIWEFSQRKVTKEFMGKEEVDLSYKVLLRDLSGEDEDSWFIVTHFTINDTHYLDFEPYMEENIGESFAAWHFVPSHSVARIEFYGDGNVAFFWYDEEWLNDLFEQNRVKISHETIKLENSINDQAYILTASTDELQKFLTKYGDEINIFELIDRDRVNKALDIEQKYNVLEEEVNEHMEDSPFGSDLIYINMRKVDESQTE